LPDEPGWSKVHRQMLTELPQIWQDMPAHGSITRWTQVRLTEQ